MENSLNRSNGWKRRDSTKQGNFIQKFIS